MNIVLLNSNYFDGKFEDFGQYNAAVNGNIGNSYISYSLLRTLEYSRIDYSSLPNIWNRVCSDLEAHQINSANDIAILVLQDQLRSDLPGQPFKNAAINLSKIKLPIVVVSLGSNSVSGQTPGEVANSISPEAVAFYQMVFERSRAIGIRGNFTAAVLDCLGFSKYQVVGCPAYFETGPNRILSPRAWNDTGYVAATGLASSSNYKLIYFLQDERFLIKPFIEGRPEKSVPNFSYPGFLDSFLESLKGDRIRFHANFDHWKQEIAESTNLVIGTRVHGAFVGLNAGIPAVVTSGDSRSEEMCGLFGIPYMKGASTFSLDFKDIVASYDFDGINQRYQVYFERYRQFWAGVGIALCPPRRISMCEDKYSISPVLRQRIKRGLLPRRIHSEIMHKRLLRLLSRLVKRFLVSVTHRLR